LRDRARADLLLWMSASPVRSVVTSACPLDCPDACSLDVTVEDGRVTAVTGNAENPVTAGFICSKVRHYAEHVYHGSRLRHPMVRVPGSRKGEARFARASWDDALALVAERLRGARERSGGESILPFRYGGSNGKLTDGALDEALFRRLGASQLLHTVCAAGTTAAARGLYGSMCGVAFPDYVHAGVILVWGANPHASNIHLVPYLKEARGRGAKIAVVDPRRTKLAKTADLHLAVHPGSDLPVALSIHRWLFESGKADLAFLGEHARGVEEFRRRAEPWTFERAARVARVEAREIERLAELYAMGDPALLRCGWGLERNRNGGSAVAAVLALPAVAGKFGKRGGGYTLSSSRGSFAFRPTYSDPEPTTRAINMNRLGRALLEERTPPIDVLFVYDANPLMTLPEQGLVRRGLEREDLFTVVFEQVLTDTARYADVLLPATTFLEHHDVRPGYGALGLQYAAPAIAPVGEARPNYAVFGELLARLGLSRPHDARGPEELLARALPEWMDVDEVRSGALVAPDFGARPVQFVDVFPRTSDGKVDLVPAELDLDDGLGLYGYDPDPGDELHPLALVSPSTERTISSSLGELHTDLVPLALHPDDARARGIGEGDRVRVFNGRGEVRTIARLDPDLRPGVAQLPKGLWSHNTENGRTANALAPDTLAWVGGGACFNDARVQVTRV
jgi:anaerobic selenocysteine-containing dehydrogenase